eukprot:930577-Pleurochrysis_carterae.AAC.4
MFSVRHASGGVVFVFQWRRGHRSVWLIVRQRQGYGHGRRCVGRRRIGGDHLCARGGVSRDPKRGDDPREQEVEVRRVRGLYARTVEIRTPRGPPGARGCIRHRSLVRRVGARMYVARVLLPGEARVHERVLRLACPTDSCACALAAVLRQVRPST